jgi:hypothetical protein
MTESNIPIKIGSKNLRVLTAADAEKIVKSIMAMAPAVAAPAGPVAEIAIKPGVERWDVKTGNDADVGDVGQNTVDGSTLPGIVPTTVEEMVNMPRPDDSNHPLPATPTSGFNQWWYEHRIRPVETTIWQLEADIVAVKLEADGDQHLVLQGDSGETMIGEVPDPDPEFIKDSPWAANIKAAREVVNGIIGAKVAAQPFVQGPGKYLLPASTMPQPGGPAPAAPVVNVGPDTMRPFKSKVRQRATVTGVGFFDVVHGQMGVSQSNGIELHPVLDIQLK